MPGAKLLSRLASLIRLTDPKAHESFADVVQPFDSPSSFMSALTGNEPNVSGFASGGKVSKAFRKWFGKSKVVDESGVPQVVYHGAQRPDRIGDTFDPARATSGPMPFFSDNPDIASNYATGKTDTSIDVETLAHFIKVGGKPLHELWRSLPAPEKQRLRQVLPAIDFADTESMEGGFEVKEAGGMYPEGIEHGAAGEHRGDYLMSAFDIWVNSGTLFGEEGKFADVLKTAGLDASFDDPHASFPGVIPAFLRIQKPLDTGSIPKRVVTALSKAADLPSSQPRGSLSGDTWDKRDKDPHEWMDKLREDISGETAFAWTTIPDWVTSVLTDHGYDGIKDTGGKYFGGIGHAVWIPFESTQIKSAVGNRGTFDPDDPRMTYAAGGLIGKAAAAFGKWFGDSKIVDEFGIPKVVFHGTARAFDQFAPEQKGSATGAKSGQYGYYFTDSPEVAASYAHYAAVYAPVRKAIEHADRLEDKAQRSQSNVDWDAHSKAVEAYEALEREIQDDRQRGQNIIPAYLSVSKPVEFDAKGMPFTDIEEELNKFIREAIRSKEHDGVILKNLDDDPGFNDRVSNHYIAFESTQIKSAVGNIGTFDPDDPRMTYAAGGLIGKAASQPDISSGGMLKALGAMASGAGKVASKAFDKWFGESKVVDEFGAPKTVYHGTPKGGFESFEAPPAPAWSEAGGQYDPENLLYGPGFYFTEDEEVADQYAKVGPRRQAFSTTANRTQLQALATKSQRILQEEYQLTGAAGIADQIERLGGLLDLMSHPKANIEDNQDALHGLYYAAQFASDLGDVDPYMISFEYEDEVKAVNLSVKNPFDIDAMASPKSLSNLQAALGTLSPNEVIDSLSTVSAWAVSEGTDTLNNQREFATDRIQRVEERFWALIMSDWDRKTTNAGVYGELASSLGKKAANKVLKSAGHDAITHVGGKIMGDRDHRVWIPFESTQIKSAVGNIGTYDPKDPRMDYAAGGLIGKSAAPRMTYANGGEVSGPLTAEQQAVADILQQSRKDHPRGHRGLGGGAQPGSTKAGRGFTGMIEDVAGLFGLPLNLGSRRRKEQLAQASVTDPTVSSVPQPVDLPQGMPEGMPEGLLDASQLPDHRPSAQRRSDAALAQRQAGLAQRQAALAQRRSEAQRDAQGPSTSMLGRFGDWAVSSKKREAKEDAQFQATGTKPPGKIMQAIAGWIQSKRQPLEPIEAANAKQPRGITPSHLVSMMGKQPEEIQQFNQEAQDKSTQLDDTEKQKEDDAQVKRELAGIVMQLKKFRKGIAKVVIAMAASPFIIQKFGEAMVNSRRGLVQYNGTIASAMAALDVQQVLLGMRQGRATETSTKELIEAQKELNEAIQPIREDIAILVNFGTTIIVKIGTGLAYIVDGIKQGIPGMQRIFDELEKGTATGGGPHAQALVKLIATGIPERQMAGNRKELKDL